MSNAGFEETQESGLKGFTEEGIVEMFDTPPEAVISENAFGNEAVDIWILLKGTSKRMEDAGQCQEQSFLIC